MIKREGCFGPGEKFQNCRLRISCITEKNAVGKLDKKHQKRVVNIEYTLNKKKCNSSYSGIHVSWVNVAPI